MVHIGWPVDSHQIGVAGEGIALLAIYQDFDLRQAVHVGRKGGYDGIHRQGFLPHAGAMAARERGIEIHHRQRVIDHEYFIYIRAFADGMR